MNLVLLSATVAAITAFTFNFLTQLERKLEKVRTMPVSIPPANTPATHADIVIRVTAASTVFVDGKPTDIASLEKLIAARVASGATKVLITSDPERKHDLLIEALEAIRSAGISEFTIETLKRVP